ncbi:MAG: hypothetical protein COB67_01345 [SAR324 cluster bacterium]|uniref:PpiC domain-containing protein n=1 Tax=SAR324 cluster bacterium TaxID=2024889 RepID=A0A2A4TAQ0_9DELT|nr:MAG: hypothetical protein COB67_01345 [SAR324 cluster bacterium]
MKTAVRSTLCLLLLLISASQILAAEPYDRIRFFLNNRIITQNEIETRLYEDARRQPVKASTAVEKAKLRQAVVDNLIQETLLDIRADELLINVSENMLSDEIEQFKKQRNLTQLTFEDVLEQQQISLAQFKKVLVRKIRQRQVISREIHSKIQVDQEQLKRDYEQKNQTIRQVRARHILLRLSPQASSEQSEQVLRRIHAIKEEITAGKPFATIASLYSEDPSAKSNHGDLGFFQKSQMVKEFSEVAFQLPLNTISDPVRTSFGFHLIEVLESKESPAAPFSKVKGKLQQQAYQKIYAQKFKELIQSLRKKVKIIEK